MKKGKIGKKESKIKFGILEYLYKENKDCKVSDILENLKQFGSDASIRTSLKKLSDLGTVELRGRGIYSITEMGSERYQELKNLPEDERRNATGMDSRIEQSKSPTLYDELALIYRWVNDGRISTSLAQQLVRGLTLGPKTERTRK